MNAIQEALRELSKQDRPRNAVDKNRARPFDESVENSRSQKRREINKKVHAKKLAESCCERKVTEEREPIFKDLWDQVYCSLTDSGQFSAYKALGRLDGQGKYKVEEIGSVDPKRLLKYDRKGFDNIVIRTNNPKPALEVAKIYGLDTKVIPHQAVFIYVPKDAPVRLDLLTGKNETEDTEEDEDRMAEEPANAEAAVTVSETFIDSTPPTKDNETHDEGNFWAARKGSNKTFEEELKDSDTLLGNVCEFLSNSRRNANYYHHAITVYNERGKEIDYLTGQRAFYFLIRRGSGYCYITNEVLGYEVEGPEPDKYTMDGEGYTIAVWINSAPLQNESCDDTLLEDFDSSLPVQLLPHDVVYDFIENVPVATSTRPPVFFPVGYLKELTREIPSKFKGGRGSEGNPFVRIVKCSEMTVYTGAEYEHLQATKTMRKDTGKERSGEKTGFSFSGDAAVVNKIGLSASGEEQLQCYIKKGTQPKAKYWISLDNEDLREAAKEEIAQYLTPVHANILLNGRNNSEEGGAKIVRLKLANIYKIGKNGNSVM